MTLRKLGIAICVAVAVLCFNTDAWSDEPVTPTEPTVIAIDEPIHLLKPSTLVTENGTNLKLPVGYFLPDRHYDALNVEVVRLQDAETRLTAENDSLREAAERPGAGLKTVALAVGVSLIVGMGLGLWAL